MIGAIAGDVIGSVHEGAAPSSRDFELFVADSTFTDDTVMTVAVASAVRQDTDFTAALRDWGRRYPNAGYGAWFRQWLFSRDPAPYNSFGNGSAMRVAAIGWAYDDLDEVLRRAAMSAEVTHDHPEGIKGAQAVAAAIFVARTRRDKQAVLELLADRFGYERPSSLETLRAAGGVDVTCQATVPAAAAVFAEASGFEHAVRGAVSVGGDADTLGCITGGLAEAHYGEVPVDIQLEVLTRLDGPLRDEVVAFAKQYGLPLAVEAP
jgi:ADP-ribosylglycohydrolase